MAAELVNVLNDENMPVASASLNAEEPGFFGLFIIVAQTGCVWQMEITNTNPEWRSFTWTVADASDCEELDGG
jgi:hypothetical protein